MQSIQPARHVEPFFHFTANGDDFEDALRNAVRENEVSMDHLHDTIRVCIDSLRSDGMQCEAALLTMKAFVKESCLKHRRRGSTEMVHSDLLMDQVVRWCISDFYEDANSRA